MDVGGGGMVGSPGTAAIIFDTLANNKVNIMMISQGPSESSISMVLNKDDLGKAITAFGIKATWQSDKTFERFGRSINCYCSWFRNAWN